VGTKGTGKFVRVLAERREFSEYLPLLLWFFGLILAGVWGWVMGWSSGIWVDKKLVLLFGNGSKKAGLGFV
jgi:hypothetical protein